MNTYKIYWIETENGRMKFEGYTYIEAKTAKQARIKFKEMGYGGEIVRVKKDC